MIFIVRMSHSLFVVAGWSGFRLGHIMTIMLKATVQSTKILAAQISLYLLLHLQLGLFLTTGPPGPFWDQRFR